MKNYISNLRNIATFSVILLHSTGPYVSDFNINQLYDWHVGNFMNSLVRFCVPIFLMISGALLLDKNEDIRVFINKRLKRIVIPFIFWTVIVFFYYNYNRNVETLILIKSFLYSLIKGASFHFWYIYLIIGIYLFIPILRRWTTTASKLEVQYFLFFWVITLFINNYTIRFLPPIELMYFSKYLGFLVLGFYLNKYDQSKNMVIIGYLSFIIGVLITILSTSYFSMKQSSFVSFFYEYLSPNVVLSAFGLFIIIKNLNFKPNSLLIKLDSISYGVYFIHIIILHQLRDILNIFNDSPLLRIILLSTTTYIVSSSIIYTMTRVKFLKKIIT